ncbi:hypothetical protein STEG23_023950, partial [Scotinomys teguina]
VFSAPYEYDSYETLDTVYSTEKRIYFCTFYPDVQLSATSPVPCVPACCHEKVLNLETAKMGRRQCKSAYNTIKNKTTPESSPPPTPKSDHCNADKAEENDLKKSLMKMLEEAFEEKMKNVSKEIGENTNKKLEEINKEIEEKKSKKLEEMNNEIEEKKNKRVEEMNKEIEEKRNKKLQELDKEIEEKINKKLKEMNKEIEEKTNKKLEEINKVIEEKTNKN